jgi:ribosomal protein S7
MSRRASVKRNLAAIDSFYNSRLVTMFVVRLLKDGKKIISPKGNV